MWSRAAGIPDVVSRSMRLGQVLPHDDSSLGVPVLALVYVAPTIGVLLADSRYQPERDAERPAIARLLDRSRIVFGRMRDTLTRHVSDARIIHLGHVGDCVFITREAGVRRETHAFMAALDEPRGGYRP